MVTLNNPINYIIANNILTKMKKPATIFEIIKPNKPKDLPSSLPLNLRASDYAFTKFSICSYIIKRTHGVEESKI